MFEHKYEHDWLDDALSEACTRLGFCFTLEAADPIYAMDPRTIEGVADGIIRAEGFDEPELNPHRDEMRKLVAKYFEAPLPDAVHEDLGKLLVEIFQAGFRVVSARYDEQHFGNYGIEYSFKGATVELWRDRGQYMLGGDADQLRALALLRVLQKNEILGALLKAAAA